MMMNPSGTVALLGNVGAESPPHTTENDYAVAYAGNDVTVALAREDDPEQWRHLIAEVEEGSFRFVQWTSTPAFRHKIDKGLQWELAHACRAAGIPLVGVHLDRFWGIRERERWIRGDDPYFRAVDVMLTADGGNQERWERAGVRHHWLLPGVSERWCVKGTKRSEFECDVAFVGSWSRYHSEARHRRELVNRLAREFGNRIKFFPERGKPAVRGKDLTDLYYSAKVVVGDSFFAGPLGASRPSPRYGSDRTPETLGRGGILLHPAVEGWNQEGDPFDTPATLTWNAWHWRDMSAQIEQALSWTPQERGRRRKAAQKHIRENHSYEARVKQIFQLLAVEGLIK